jgi:hypothetical protein
LALGAAITGCASAPSYRPSATPTATTLPAPFFGPETADDEPRWGVRGGIVVGIHPAVLGFGRRTQGGPRGLIRLGYEQDGGIYFINFMALSPITADGRRGMSELEDSPLDGRPGILIWAYPPAFHDDPAAWRKRRPPPVHEVAHVWPTDDGARALTVVLRYEEFHNGARTYLVVTLREDRPREVIFQMHTEPDSPRLTSCVLSTTFGNLTRLRDAYLADGIVTAKELWPHYRGSGFAKLHLFPLARLPRNRRGDVIFAAHPDEPRPWEVPGYPHPAALTQYYRKPAGTFDESTHGLVNGRTVFWKTTRPVPGGISFENFALVEDWRPGTPLIFGYSPRTPEDLLSQ